MKTTARAVALSVLAAVVLAGCIRIDMDITLNEDDTASGEMIMAVSEDLAELMGEEELSNLAMEDDIEGATTEPYEAEDGYTGTRSTFSDVPLEELSDATMSITREGDDYVVAGAPADPSAQLGGEEIPPSAEATLSVTFPGTVSDHNGNLEGTTVTWDLLDAPQELHARGAASADDGFPLWIILVVLGVMGIGIGIAIVLITSTRRKGPDSQASAEAEAQAAELQHHSQEPSDEAPVSSDPDDEFSPEPDAPAPKVVLTDEPGVVATPEEAADEATAASAQTAEALDAAATDAEQVEVERVAGPPIDDPADSETDDDASDEPRQT